jgi:hypothetical protein
MEPNARTILVHLNVEIPVTDKRDPDDIADAIMDAFEVGSDDDSVRDLFPKITLAEEV